MKSYVCISFPTPFRQPGSGNSCESVPDRLPGSRWKQQTTTTTTTTNSLGDGSWRNTNHSANEKWNLALREFSPGNKLSRRCQKTMEKKPKDSRKNLKAERERWLLVVDLFLQISLSRPVDSTLVLVQTGPWPMWPRHISDHQRNNQTYRPSPKN